jgi:hypothetical protein
MLLFEKLARKRNKVVNWVTKKNCSSPISDTLDFIIPGSRLVTYPNPVTNTLLIKNTAGEKMSIQLSDGSRRRLFRKVGRPNDFCAF